MSYHIGRAEYVRNVVRTEERIVGACADSDNPDLWFPELGRGSGGAAKAKEKAQEINVALAICKSCDKKVECLKEGMLFDNLPYGIWGGMLAGKRLAMAGVKSTDYHPFTQQGIAMHFYSRVKPYLRR